MSIRTFNTWRDVPSDFWIWKNFSSQEVACRGTGQLVINTEAMDKLQELRDRLGKPMLITSGYRSPKHNRNVGGNKNSRHMKGDAFDISMTNHDPIEFERQARIVGFTGFGFYPKSNFIHIDLGPVRNWGTRFQTRETSFAPEHRPDEKLSQSRIALGSGTATVAGTAVVAEAVTEIQKAENSFSAGNIFGMMIGLLILGGAAYSFYARWDDAGRPTPWART